MLLAHCINECEDELICDFAEYYNIYNYKDLLPAYAGILCAGLRNGSRVRLKLAGIPLDLTEALLARMVDELAFISWSKTKDGQKNRKRPQSVLKALMEKKKDEYESFKTAEDFHAAWADITAKEATENAG